MGTEMRASLIISKVVEPMAKRKNMSLHGKDDCFHIVGEHAYVFDVLSKETAITFTSGQNVFVMKVLGFERDLSRYQPII